MLWIGLHLPWLSLESCAATLPPAQAGQPLALLDAHRILAASAAARALGVQPGMKRATALSLAPHLLLGQADAPRDLAALTSVAHAALAFTPAVSLSPPDGVLLEVRASLRYFGGREALLRKLHAALAPLGHRLRCASAPTALGAAWLSRWRAGEHCADRPSLARWLDAAPVELLASSVEHADTFQGMGMATLRDVRRLPRTGLAQRFGQALLDELDSAYGDRPDPREPVSLPQAFSSQLELFTRADTTDQLLHGAQVLLARMVAWLSAQHAFVRRFSLVMKHEPRWGHARAHTELSLALAEPSRDAAHMLVLLRERLAALQLPAPTLELALQADDIARQPPPNTELFATVQSERAGLTRLIERLQARLGPAQVQRLQPVADHRPERATATQAAEALMPPPHRDGVASPPCRSHRHARPVWVFSQPRPLPERRMRPELDGQPLRLLSGPERIEAGWWDSRLAERDYFIAQTPEGALVWIFRERPSVSALSMSWYLQGRFA